MTDTTSPTAADNHVHHVALGAQDVIDAATAAADLSFSGELGGHVREALLRSAESETLDLATSVVSCDAHPPSGGTTHKRTKLRPSPARVSSASPASPTNFSMEFQSCADLSSLARSANAASLPISPHSPPTSPQRMEDPTDGGHTLLLFTPQSLTLSPEGDALLIGASPPLADDAPTRTSVAVSPLPPVRRQVDAVSLSADRVTLSRRHRNWKQCRVDEAVQLTDFSLYVAQGSLHCILSTMPHTARSALQLLAGVRSPTAGTVLGNDVPTFSRLYRRRVAWISDVSGLTDSLTVRQNLSFAYRMRVADTKENENRILARVAATLGLEKLLDHLVSGLRSAHTYMLCVGLELVLDPAVLLLDNPLVHFTPPEITSVFLVAVQRLVRGSLGAPVTVILSTTEMGWSLYKELTGLTVLAAEKGEVIFSGCTGDLEPFLHHDAAIPNTTGESIADLLAQMEDTHTTTEVAAAFRRSPVYRKLELQVETHRRRAARVNGLSGTATTVFSPSPEPENGTTTIIVVDASSTPAARAGMSAAAPPAFQAHASPSYGVQFGLLLMYMIRKNVVVSLWYLGPWMCMFVVFVTLSAVVLRIEFATGTNGAIAVQNYCGVVFMMLASACQTGLAFIDVEVGERKAFRHFVRNRYLRGGQYVLATMLRLLLLGLFMFCIGLLCALLLGVPVWPLSTLMGILFLVQSALLLVLVYLFGGRRGFVVPVQGLYYLYSTLFSGYLVNANALPHVVQSLSMLRYAYGGAMLAGVQKTCASAAPGTDICEYAVELVRNNAFYTFSTTACALFLLLFGAGFFAVAVLLMYTTITRVNRG